MLDLGLLIYLDHNATTKPDEKVLGAAIRSLSGGWGNPSSVHSLGNAAHKALELSRQQIAAFLSCTPKSVVFTSGATESINSAIHSAISKFPERKHIVTSEVEHSAVLGYCKYLEDLKGYEITRLPVDSNGKLSIHSLEEAIRPDTALVSLIWANNETGVVWPVSDFAELCQIRGVPLHLDAVQAIGRIPVNFEKSSADYLSISGHKFGAIKGSGVLVIREPDLFVPLVIGGKQERGLRGGTESVPLCVAIGEAAKLCNMRDISVWERVTAIRDTFEDSILGRIPGAVIHGKPGERLPNTTSLHIPGVDGDAVVTYLDQKGICVSSGSACMESAITPSHVIYAMTRSHDIASETLRISLGLESTQDELERLADELVTFCELYD